LFLGGVRLQEFGYGTFELRQAFVDFDDLIRRDGVCRIDVWAVLSPLQAAFAPVE
jgi:hypothetical protein